MTYLEKETDAIYRAYAAYAKALAELQATCEHKTLLEAPREESASGYFKALPYVRVCEDCGVEERSPWGTWKVLTGRAYSVNRNDIYDAKPFKTYIPEELIERYKV